MICFSTGCFRPRSIRSSKVAVGSEVTALTKFFCCEVLDARSEVGADLCGSDVDAVQIDVLDDARSAGHESPGGRRECGLGLAIQA